MNILYVNVFDHEFAGFGSWQEIAVHFKNNICMQDRYIIPLTSRRQRVCREQCEVFRNRWCLCASRDLLQSAPPCSGDVKLWPQIPQTAAARFWAEVCLQLLHRHNKPLPRLVLSSWKIVMRHRCSLNLKMGRHLHRYSWTLEFDTFSA